VLIYSKQRGVLTYLNTDNTHTKCPIVSDAKYISQIPMTMLEYLT